jgi:uncharacterized protein YndB with AHSA1/START domain
MSSTTNITVEVLVNRDIRAAWDAFISPKAITKWNFASADWHCPTAANDLRAGGEFNYRMEAKDGSMGFNFSGTYREVVPLKRIKYSLGDDREVVIEFHDEAGKTRVVETFVAESTYSIEEQKGGWQAILGNYKKHVEDVASWRHPTIRSSRRPRRATGELNR